MSIQRWFRLPRVRRGLAVSLVVLSTGGLVLARTPSGTGLLPGGPEARVVLAGGSNARTFSGPGIHGRFALSHTRVLAGGERRVYAELDLQADPTEQRGRERAPLSIAVVLDTSGSMGGEKIEEARRSIVRMLREMRDDDEVAVVRYASDAELIQPLARVGKVREALISRVEALAANGGTNIPAGLSMGIGALADARKGRVRRVVLASDGLDSGRANSETIARGSAERGITISSMGIGLDFDEGYMGGVAQAGHGNFAFVKDGASLAGFLHRELDETATTTVEAVTAELRLPEGVRFVQAIGADARMVAGGAVEVKVGSLFAGDERRVMIELSASVPDSQIRALDGAVTWMPVGGDTATARFAGLSLTGSSDPLAVDEGRDGAVFANAASVIASARQLEAAAAYQRGDGAQAQALLDQNVADLKVAATAAPAAMAPRLAQQARAYEGTKREFAAAPAESDKGRSAAKAAAARDRGNFSRNAAF
jgi:Ca-activated chloride channel family protein